MKKIFCVLLISFSFAAFAQKKYEAFDITEDNLIVPPNGIFLSTNIFMDDSEVMNSHYLEYLHFLSQDSSDEAIIQAYPDTSIFGKVHLLKFLAHNKEYYKKKGNRHRPVALLLHDDVVNPPMKKHHWYNYFSYHGTKHCPVVGLSYQQALNYCKWRSDFVTNYFNSVLKKKSKYKAIKDQNVRFEFSLPSEAEWELAASAGLDITQFPLGYAEIKKDSCHMFNTLYKCIDPKIEKKNEPEFIFWGQPNASGFYNMIGNVSEMIAGQGISKGGSYQHTASECRISNRIVYTNPQKWLGFRCICKVIVTSAIN